MTQPFHLATSSIAMFRHSIAINTTSLTKRQQFSAVTVSLKSGFFRFLKT